MTTNTSHTPKIANKAKWNKKTFAIIAGVLAIIGIIIIAISRAATVGPNLGFYMTTTNASPAVGAQFDVKLYANTGGQQVQSVVAAVLYDTNQVRLDLAAVAPAADPINGVDGFDATIACTPSTSCSSPGKASFALTMTATPPAVATKAGDGIYVGTLRFTALKAGATGIVYDPTITPANPNADPPVLAAPLTGFVNNASASLQDALNKRSLQNPTITALDGTPPTVPGKPVAGTITMSTINLTWPASTDSEAGASGMAGYRIYRNGTQVGTSTTASFSDGSAPMTPLTPNTTYSYTVSAYDVAGNNSAQSTALSVKTLPDSQAPTVPGSPTKGTVTMTTVGLSWTGSTDNVGVTGYRIYRNGTQVGTSATTSFTDNGPSPGGLTPGTSYSYTISAYDAAGNNSTASSASSISTAPDTQAPTKPTITSATTATNNVTLSWSGSTDNVAVSGYRVLRNGTQVGTTTGTVTSFENKTVPVGTYQYTIIAVDAAGNASTPSDAKSVSIYGSADVDKNGVVNIQDIATVLANYGKSGAGVAGDANGDGVVNIQDIAYILTYYGSTG